MDYYIDITTAPNNDFKMWYICRKSDKESVKWGYFKDDAEMYMLTSYWISVLTARDRNLNPPIYFLWFSEIEGKEYREQFMTNLGIYEDVKNVVMNT